MKSEICGSCEQCMRPSVNSNRLKSQKQRCKKKKKKRKQGIEINEL